MLKNYDDFEKKNFKFLEIQNSIESFIYNKKEWIEDKTNNHRFAKEEELNEFSNVLNKASQWYDSNEHLDYDKLKEKYKELKKAFSVFNTRMENYEKRKNSIKYFRSEIKSALKQGKNWMEEKPWIEEYYNTTFKNITNELTNWIDQMEGEQDKIAEYENEILNKKMMDSKLDELYKSSKEMKKIKRPLAKEKGDL